MLIAARYLNPSEGETIFFITESAIPYSSHQHGKGDYKPPHADGYACRRYNGMLQVVKFHSDDDFQRHAEPNWRNVVEGF